MKALFIIRRILALLVGLWALGTAVFYFFFAKVSFASTTATATAGGSSVASTTSGQVPWITQVWYFPVAVMVSFSLLLVGVAITEWRGSLTAAVPLTLLAIVITFVTGFSIGGLYFPASAIAFLGLILLVIETLSTRFNRPDIQNN